MRQQRSGSIALFGSVGSWHGGPAAGMYCATKWAVSGLSESLRAELAPFNISVCCVEPGYFRTGFLNAGARVQTARRMGEYEASAVGEARKLLEVYNDKQPGDLVKGVRVIVDCFERGDVPIRLVLGSDARKAIEGKCESTLEYLRENRGVIDGTDYAEGE